MIYQPSEDSYLLEKEVKKYSPKKSVLDIGSGSGIQAQSSICFWANLDWNLPGWQQTALLLGSSFAVKVDPGHRRNISIDCRAPGLSSVLPGDHCRGLWSRSRANPGEASLALAAAAFYSFAAQFCGYHDRGER